MQYSTKSVKGLWDMCKNPFMALRKEALLWINMVENWNSPTSFGRNLPYRISYKSAKRLTGHTKRPRKPGFIMNRYG
jgi:hypothetical protein